jgi:predicted ATPase with chaperone activity
LLFQGYQAAIFKVGTRHGLLVLNKKILFNCVHPCPCGYYGDSQKPCSCAHALVTKYQKRISGPLLDRIDIHIEVPYVDYEKLSGDDAAQVVGAGVSSHAKRQTDAHDCGSRGG